MDPTNPPAGWVECYDCDGAGCEKCGGIGKKPPKVTSDQPQPGH